MVVDWGFWVLLAASLFFVVGILRVCRGSAVAAEASDAIRTRKPTVTIDLKGALFNSSDLTFSQAELSHFLRLCSLCSFYTITEVADDNEEAQILSMLKSCGAFEAGLKQHRVMFCDSLPGVVSMVRQLQPVIHIEDDAWVRAQLKNKIANVFAASEGLEHCVATIEALVS